MSKAPGRPATKEFAGKIYGGALTDKEADVLTICGVAGDDDDDVVVPGAAAASPPEAEVDPPRLDADKLRVKLAAVAAEHDIMAIEDRVVECVDRATEEFLAKLIKALPTAPRNYLADVRRGRIAPAPTPRHRRARSPVAEEHPRVEGPHRAAKRRGALQLSLRRANGLGLNPRALWAAGALGR